MGETQVTFPFAVQTQFCFFKRGGGSKSVMKVHSWTMHVRELLTEPDCVPAHLAQHQASCCFPVHQSPKPNFGEEKKVNSPLLPYQGKVLNKSHLG